jgi:hypothetical protein
MRRALVLLGALALANLGPARAQTAAEVLQRGVSAYENLQLDVAAALIRRALAFPASSGLPKPERARALSYLAAAELFQNRQDSATATFQQLVWVAPRYRPSDLIFPPPVLNLFDRVRQTTKAVDIAAPDSVDLPFGSEPFTSWLYASILHGVDAAVLQGDGKLVRGLYRGPLGDSLALRWDGRDSAGVPVPSGSYQLRVQSMEPSGEVAGVALLPLELKLVRRDTLPYPPRPDSLLRPEHRPVAPAFRALAAGVALAGLTALLPAVIGGQPEATGARYVVGVSLGLAGVAGFLSHHPGQLIPEIAAANRALLEKWDRDRQALVQENRRRREDTRLQIVVGTVVQLRGGVR